MSTLNEIVGERYRCEAFFVNFDFILMIFLNFCCLWQHFNKVNNSLLLRWSSKVNKSCIGLHQFLLVTFKRSVTIISNVYREIFFFRLKHALLIFILTGSTADSIDQYFSDILNISHFKENATCMLYKITTCRQDSSTATKRR